MIQQKKNLLEFCFKIHARGSTLQREVMAGVTIFLAMLYSVVVIPNMLKLAGFPPLATFKYPVCFLLAM
ncbi:MAG TPA: hypothetical protein VGH95_04730 [Candidatus Aquirickettsiella sp.]|jgi:AGZA family xanthine/uracil permease-like MFS transporter